MNQVCLEAGTVWVSKRTGRYIVILDAKYCRYVDRSYHQVYEIQTILNNWELTDLDEATTKLIIAL